MTIPILKSKAGGLSLGDPKDTSNFKYFTYLDFPKFASEHNNLISRLLSKEMFSKLIHKKTARGYTFSNAIQAGIECPRLKRSITAGDEESYEVFKDIFNQIIKEWHGFDPYIRNHKADISPAKLDLFPLKSLSLDLDRYIVSSRIRAVRNIAEYALPSGVILEERVEIENILKAVFKKLAKKFRGQYRSLSDISDKQKTALRENGHLFQEPGMETLLLNSGAARSWPEGRGIFLSDDQKAVCWGNEEDHCKIIALQKGADIEVAFKNFAKLSEEVIGGVESSGHKVMRNVNLGFIASCPSNLGTGLCASVKLNLHALIKNRPMLEKVCRENCVELRGTQGEGSLIIRSVVEISSKQSLGLTETEIIQNLINSIAQIISLESKLSR